MSVRQDLTGTLDLLRKDGWCQGSFGFYDSEPHCLLGALSKSMDGSSALRAVKQEIAPMEMVVWNDTPGRTFEEVEALLQRVIDKY